ncbi:hypothetical protein GCM10009133_05930 [Cocleimonas flava]|uniref:Uncharacterized protein DUF3131 n=1 Tax=Cocleimonas flava TaxID=634765 RepID=A0A4R1F330_9GAMM|nr:MULTISPECIES: DUF3131 domain-containing protein [Cocleimonas]MEB8432174.1 DUF3131 domain-containing protein [Cocleimonas sp. KMM 6892]MEC4714740.1 DUF3131 domain-containing protein [Cocleimonas sp. KMM 6895]MEC4744446.1 DUF3131 domain-containing protein [Cocleimonas sp. KMM 6896]TCJ86962.1 uncharacterized protein DUF3131 [Cocleimonas flava]
MNNNNVPGFKQNLVRARSHIIFMLALITAFSLVISLSNASFEDRVTAKSTVKNVIEMKLPPQRNLTEEEKQWALIAWKYFQNNTIESTGLANSANAYKSTTLWDSSSYLLAVISASRLGIIDKPEFENRVNKFLATMLKLPLYEGKLPNKVYNTETLEMVDYNNKKTEKGLGWSAIDIGRLMVPLNILVWNYPEFTTQVKAITKQWDLSAAVDKGDMYGALNEDGKTVYLQEGRLGYEEYASKAFQLVGLDVSSAIDYTSWLKFIDIEGINIPTDSRSPEKFTAHNYVVSEPYILDGIEYGWDQMSREFSGRVYTVQEERYKNTGKLTAVSEDNIDQAPYFVYNTVFTSGKKWNAITEDGTDASEFKTLSTKAAFGWHMLYETEYTKKLMKVASQLYDPNLGWYSGLYDKTGEPNKALTANTNGIILETLAYKQTGQLLKP